MMEHGFLMVGSLDTTPDGTVTIVIPGRDLRIDVPWREAFRVATAILEAAVKAAVLDAGVESAEVAKAILAAVNEVDS